MRTMRILSVDWDYFFPSSHIYDWGHGETAGSNNLYGSIIWPLRFHNRSIYDQENEALKASNYYWPDESLLCNFWSKTVAGAPGMIFCADSHLRLAEVLRLLSEDGQQFSTCFNYDAHHDWQYENSPNPRETIDCGNWAKASIVNNYIEQYKLFYPPWRKQHAEVNDEWYLKCVDKAEYTIQEEPLEFSLIFICQSRSWCPPWADNRFTFFVNELLTAHPNTTFHDIDNVMTARPFEPGPDIYKMQNDIETAEALNYAKQQLKEKMKGK